MTAVRTLVPARRASRWVVASIAVLSVPACEVSRFGAPDPVSREGEKILSLWQGSVLAALAVGALVWTLIAIAVLRFRRRRHDDDDTLPSQKHQNIPIEVVYTAAPLVIVAVLFAFTLSTQRQVTRTVADPDVVVDVVGFQWQWQFRYPDHDITVIGTYDEPATMVLPVGRTVRLRLVSTDVNHSFWVPRFLSKRDLIPGVRNEIDLVIDQEGSWVGRCAEFCGIDHYRMNFAVRAVAPGEYERWLAARQQDATQEAGRA